MAGVKFSGKKRYVTLECPIYQGQDTDVFLSVYSNYRKCPMRALSRFLNARPLALLFDPYIIQHLPRLRDSPIPCSESVSEILVNRDTTSVDSR